MTTKKHISLFVVSAVIVIGLVYFKYQAGFLEKSQGTTPAEPIVKKDEGTSEQLREVSANASYTAPGGEHTDRFTLFLDNGGLVRGTKVTDTLEPGSEHELYLAKFAQELLVKIEGKKLSELQQVDRVSSSSLTTTAFNEALTTLRSL